jgi:hypothetical protein
MLSILPKILAQIGPATAYTHHDAFAAFADAADVEFDGFFFAGGAEVIEFDVVVDGVAGGGAAGATTSTGRGFGGVFGGREREFGGADAVYGARGAEVAAAGLLGYDAWSGFTAVFGF